MLDLDKLTRECVFLDETDAVHSAELMREARDELTRMRRIVGMLANFVLDEGIAGGSPEPSGLLIKCGLATWQKYNPEIHGDILACEVEIGDRVWITTDECKRLIEEANDA